MDTPETTTTPPPPEAVAAPAAPAPAAPPPAPVVIIPPAQLGVVDLRARLLRTKLAPFKVIEVDGVEVALVKPSEGLRGDIDAAALGLDSAGRMRPGNQRRRQALAVVAMLHAVVIQPDGAKRPGAKVFTDHDLEQLLAEPFGSGSIIDQFGGPCLAFLAEVKPEEATAAAKND